MNYFNYFTEIEEHFVRRRGKHLFVSPMDWSLMATWRDSGVPLHVVLRGIDRAMDSFLAKQARGGSRVSTLFYCHASVMEEYAHHIEAHLGEEQPDTSAAAPPADDARVDKPEGPDKQSIVEFLTARMSEIKSLSVKLSGIEGAQDGIDRIVSRLGEIMGDLATDHQVNYEALDRDLAILDETLVGMLRASLAPERLVEWDQEARKELKIYRKKLPKETYAKILETFLRTKIHRQHGVGELSLFHM